MTMIDCKAIFNLQQQIIDSPSLSPEEKLKMLSDSIKKTLGEQSET